MSDAARPAVLCPAKINLGLRVLHRRDDGYHEIRSRLQAIDLRDRLEAEPHRADLELTVHGGPAPAGPDNLVWRAAEMLRTHAGTRRGASLVLHKAIPVGAGMGGGSSDAAGALVLLDRLWDLRTPTVELSAIAARLGSDVPFFLVGGTADVTGRGEQVRRVAPSRQMVVLLGVPPFGIATAEAYRWLSARLTPPREDVSVPRLSGDGGGYGTDSDARWLNDFEPVVFARRPSLRRFRDDLLDLGARAALLCGSGSTVFGVFGSADERDRARKALRSRYDRWRLVGTRTVPDAVCWAVDP